MKIKRNAVIEVDEWLRNRMMLRINDESNQVQVLSSKSRRVGSETTPHLSKFETVNAITNLKEFTLSLWRNDLCNLNIF
jgi:hypothetical protein